VTVIRNALSSSYDIDNVGGMSGGHYTAFVLCEVPEPTTATSTISMT
jgi:hypothetical protein